MSDEVKREDPLTGAEIAVIGMACRFPGADDIEQFWRNLCGGVESLTLLSDEDLARAGVDPSLAQHPNYVRRAAVLAGVELFDPAFFGYTPLEAKVMDPQHRLFLECAWEVFEQAGYDPETYPAPVGVFTGAKTNTYLLSLFSNREFFRTLDNFQIALGNDLASMATRVSFKLNLRGPSYALHTACSTSLVAVHLACQSLLLDECRMAVAGGAAINVPHRKGYLYQKGGILSPDGSCRTFDAGAQGSNFGNGAGAVLLKRLEDALADGDPIWAVIRGSATNNDGAQKASYTAPGVEGQTAVLLEAMACADVEPRDISYVEAHGTATDLGDSIEMLALTEAFRAGTAERGFCALGSVKTNIGHLETAAGIAGLIKTALALKHRQIPPSLHFQEPSPKIDFAGSPFYVNTELAEWRSEGRPRRAGLSSFGIGSTNAHVILEEAPEPAASSQVSSPAARPYELLVLSARTGSALETMTANLARHLEAHPEINLSDAAYTLHIGRKGFQHRRTVVCPADPTAAIAALREADGPRRTTGDRGLAGRPVVFLFPGLGDHYADMGLGLYQTEPVFRAALDRCAELLRPELGADLRELLYPRGTDAAEEAGAEDLRRFFGRGGGASDRTDRSDRTDPSDLTRRRLHETRFAQPATFAVEYALAQLWLAWGVRPQAMLGYSVGEYVAACLAGVLSLEDALKVVARRALQIQELPAGAMTAVPLPESEIAPLLARHGLSLAALNGPAVSVASGPEAGVAALEKELGERGIVCRRLPATHAFHSSMMEPLSGTLTELARTVARKAPHIPYLSNVTGTWITAAEATDPAYWSRHMCGPVRFADGLAELLKEGSERIFLEVGPGQGLGSFVRLHPDCDRETGRRVVASMRPVHGGRPSAEVLLAALGQLWTLGAPVDWHAFHNGERRLRVPLPTYPFERQAYWVDPDWITQATPAPRRVTLDKQEDLADWFYRPVWRRAGSSPLGGGGLEQGGGQEGGVASGRDLLASKALPAGGAPLLTSPLSQPPPSQGGGTNAPEVVGGGLLLFALSDHLASHLRAAGRAVMLAAPGESFAAAGSDRFTLRPDYPEDYSALLVELARRGAKLSRIVHLWSAGGEPESFERTQELGFYSLLFLAQALGRQGVKEPLRIDVVTRGVQSVAGNETLLPERATVLGPCKVIPQEMARITCRSIDLAVEETDEDTVGLLAAEILGDGEGETLALRGGERWEQGFAPVRLESSDAMPPRLRERGVYLLTGGLGGLGLAVAEHLARRVQARLILTSRSASPERSAQAVAALEAAGAEVMTAAVDVSDEAAMRELVAAARQRFGRIDGVFHLAGIPGGGILQLKTREAAERIMAPKVRGARVLDAIFQGEEIDFLVLFSSIASVLGEFGQADYCGANAFLDAMAERNVRRGGPPTITIDWDIWREVGLAVHTEVPAHLRPWRQEMLDQAILTSEGVEALDRILRADLPRVVVSAQDLHGRIELGKSFTGESFLAELEKMQAPQSTPRPMTSPTAQAPPRGDAERRIAAVWQRVLGVEPIGLQDNFFDLGGNSLLALQVVSDLSRDLGMDIAPVTLFEAPTVSALARRLAIEEEAPPVAAPVAAQSPGERAVAIVGMAGRFPGARNVEELWENLCGGVESVTFFSEEELLAAGVDRELLADPRYVRAGSVLEGIDQFDAGLFGYSPREAEVMDPQHRIFLEGAWELFERAGWNTETYPGKIGVFAGSNLSTYLLRLYADPDVRRSVNMLQAILGNDKDSLTTTVSYKLNLRGPSIAVQTFCSTSLVAVHMACQSLRSGECDMAVAGGIRVVVPDHQGYLFEQGGIAPSDGHSRSFDAQADGSILGHGVGLVLLKRLSDALADGDHIHAVIRGSAINNDGSLKAGYTAPSVGGQAAAITAAVADAGIDPARLGYVEAHGSATALGDPIEIAALTQAFQRFTGEKGFCPIGSVKANFGHLDRAAGVTGLIKTVLALENGAIPPSINFSQPNPQIDFAAGPFFVNTELREWKANGEPRLAAVNSLGMGGTNAHVILEEAPPLQLSEPGRPWQLLTLSAKSPQALDQMTSNLADHLESHPGLDFADVAFTLQVGRRGLEHRRIAVCHEAADAIEILRGGDPRRVFTTWREEGERPVVFLFSGLGGQYVNMGRGLYDSEPAFREAVDHCARELEPLLGVDLRSVLYPTDPTDPSDLPAGKAVDLRRMLRRDPATQPLDETRLAQPALFVLEYALARLWIEWGIRPAAVAGYSVGEYVAACLAGVLSLTDALELVAERARLIQELPGGAMLAVGLAEDTARSLLSSSLNPELSLAAVNGPEQSVLAGPLPAIEELERRLTADGIACRRLAVTHAFHSRMMEPAFDALVETARGVELHPPALPLLSNLTGRWMTAEEAVDPTYWARHMCGTVRFAESVAELVCDPHRVLLELGPGPTLASLVLQHPAVRAEGRETVVLPTVRHSYETQPDLAYALTTLGKLWLLGIPVDWADFHAHARRRRVLLPAYPFERRRYWIETRIERRREEKAGAYLYARSWKRSPHPRPSPSSLHPPPGEGRQEEAALAWLILADGYGIGDRIAAVLRDRGDEVAVSRIGEAFDVLKAQPDRILHLWGLGGGAPLPGGGSACGRGDGGEGLLSLSAHLDATARLWVVTDRLLEVDGEERIRPETASLLGSLAGRPDSRVVDVVAPGPGSAQQDRLVGQLLAELDAESPERLAAWRGNHRWVPLLEPATAGEPRLRDGAVYLIAGSSDGPAGHFVRYLEQAAPAARVIVLEPGAIDLAAAEARWGEVRGLIGVPETVSEALALDAVRWELGDRSLDFALLLSPDPGLWPVLDALASSAGAGWTSVCWGLGERGAELVPRLLAAGMGQQLAASALPLPASWSPLDGLPEAPREEIREVVGFYPRPTLRVEWVAPRNATEEAVAAIWQNLLGVAQVGVHDNFLDLGGDSLLATRLVSRMRDAFHLDLPVRLFFERSTVAELAIAVDEERARQQKEEDAALIQQVQELSEEELELEIARLENLLANG
jgi:acyl transferase domain-containing protein/acyl carrier protein